MSVWADEINEESNVLSGKLPRSPIRLMSKGALSFVIEVTFTSPQIHKR